MAKRIRVILDGEESVARLHEDAAPQTVARFWAALPLERCCDTCAGAAKQAIS